mmetsp:Transcript_50711/g.93751  ORF Transcript_50711/g.93751 Transcript_50711/m.93751 type:complete len:369 (-) Transcript_50711:282-1388(-)
MNEFWNEKTASLSLQAFAVQLHLLAPLHLLLRERIKDPASSLPGPLKHSLSRRPLEGAAEKVEKDEQHDRKRYDHCRHGLDLDRAGGVRLWEGRRRAVLDLQKVAQRLPSLLHVVLQQLSLRYHLPHPAVVLLVRRDCVLLDLVRQGVGSLEVFSVFVHEREQPPEVLVQVLHVGHPEEVRRGLGDGLGQHVPAAEPHVGILPRRQNELAIGVLFQDLLVVERHGQVRRGAPPPRGDELKVRLAHESLAGLEGRREHVPSPHIENFRAFVQVLGVKARKSQLVEGEGQRIRSSPAVPDADHLQAGLVITAVRVAPLLSAQAREAHRRADQICLAPILYEPAGVGRPHDDAAQYVASDLCQPSSSRTVL